MQAEVTPAVKTGARIVPMPPLVPWRELCHVLKLNYEQGLAVAVALETILWAISRLELITSQSIVEKVARASLLLLLLTCFLLLTFNLTGGPRPAGRGPLLFSLRFLAR